MTFGEYFKKCRQQTGKTLREFCEECEFTPVRVSELERGCSSWSPSRAAMAVFAAALGLERASPEWVEFYELAASERFHVPYPPTDEELLAELPQPAAIPRGLDVDKLADTDAALARALRVRSQHPSDRSACINVRSLEKRQRVLLAELPHPAAIPRDI